MDHLSCLIRADDWLRGLFIGLELNLSILVFPFFSLLPFAGRGFDLEIIVGEHQFHFGIQIFCKL